MVLPFSFPGWVTFVVAGPEGAKNLAGERPPPDSDPLKAEFRKNLVRLSRQFSASANRRFKFQERCQLLIGVHNKNALLRRDARRQSRSFAPARPSLTRSPNSIRLS
jgi:hypothetical protein